MNEVIQFKDVHFYSDDNVHILKGITGSVYEGEITTFVGPSGAGKSTLLKLCNGLLTKKSGELLIKGKQIEEYDPIELRKLVGIALQSAPMVSGDVFYNLNLPLQLQGKVLDEQDAKHLLNVVGLGEAYIQRNIKDLSGGQRQKVSIARTLVNRPEILLLDEITSSLDQVSQKEIDELIGRVSQTYGTTIIWITHNIQQAISVGTSTWVLMSGELIEACKSDSLLKSKNEHVQAFLKGDIR
ncbi:MULTISPECIES: ABC transporter ATP-binding protein [Bacillus]|uniref:ABC transporter ATP-binding protein n=1 Tax=Bacillus TaxID=1386 RepID=UPI000BB72897|nr:MULTISPECIES: phosphate ABC transporter ATP-binding protein [Bacillus]